MRHQLSLPFRKIFRVYNMSVSDTTYKKILSWILNSHFFTHDISCCSWSKNHLTIRPYNYGGICFAWSTNRMQIPLYLYSLAGDFYWHDHMTSCDDVTTADIMSKKMWIEDSRKNFFVSSIRYIHIINSSFLRMFCLKIGKTFKVRVKKFLK